MSASSLSSPSRPITQPRRTKDLSIPSADDCLEGRLPESSAEHLRRAAAVFRALSHEGRLAVLLCLSRDEGLSVSQLLERVGGEQSALSHQLRLLKQARLVKSERVGRHIIYSLYDRHVSHVVSDTLAHVKEEF